MALFKVGKKYNDEEIGRILEAGEEVEMTVKRAKKVTDKLGDKYLVRLDKPKKDGQSDED